MSRENRITTVEQLDALPDFTIVQDGRDPKSVYQSSSGWWGKPFSHGEFLPRELMADHEYFRVLWSPPVHDPSLDVHPNCMIGRK